MADSSWLGNFSGTGEGLPTTRQLYRVLSLLGYDGDDHEGVLSYLANFTQRWGKPSAKNLLAIARRFAPKHPWHASETDVDEMVIRPVMGDAAVLGPDTPEEEDATFALAALGVMRMPDAPSALLPYLSSPYAIERWLSAIGLVALHDERVIPTLRRMLLKFIGPNQPLSPEYGPIYLFRLWRAHLLRGLSAWGDSRLVPFMRAALFATVRAEESEVPEPHGPEHEFVRFGERYTGEEAWKQFRYEWQDWIEEEHRLVYALGQVGAFGALVGVPTRPGVYYLDGPPSPTNKINEVDGKPVELDASDLTDRYLPESRAKMFRSTVWRVHACCGFLEPQFRDRLKWIYAFTAAPEFAEVIERLLEGQFGLDVDERRQALEDYERAGFLTGTVADYERFARQAREDAEEQ